MGSLIVGSEAHKELFCRTFIETHEAYAPSAVVWPEMDADARARLLRLPIWDEAVNTERETAQTVLRMAEMETDPVVREAIALQGFEERRHAALLDLFTRRYGIPAKQRPAAPAGADPWWTFMRTEYGECFDAFFAFGLFSLARDTGFFPEPLVRLFDPVLQEEARHVLFFVNWIAYQRARRPVWHRPGLDARRALALSLQILSRIRTALDLGGADQENFTMKSHGAVGDFSIRRFLEVCLRENERRLVPYGNGLLQPRFVPALAKLALRVLPS